MGLFTGVPVNRADCSIKAFQSKKFSRLGREMLAGCASARLLLDQFDFVAVGVLDEGDDRAAVLHRAGFARHRAAAALDLGTGGIGTVSYTHLTLPTSDLV